MPVKVTVFCLKPMTGGDGDIYLWFTAWREKDVSRFVALASMVKECCGASTLSPSLYESNNIGDTVYIFG